MGGGKSLMQAMGPGGKSYQKVYVQKTSMGPGGTPQHERYESSAMAGCARDGNKVSSEG